MLLVRLSSQTKYVCHILIELFYFQDPIHLEHICEPVATSPTDEEDGKYLSAIEKSNDLDMTYLFIIYFHRCLNIDK